MAVLALAAVTAVSAPPASSLKVDGPLDARVVQTIIVTNTSEAMGCYDAYLATHPAAEGKLVLHWAVAEDGSVEETCQSPGTTIPKELGRCVSERVAAWRFPAPGVAQRAEVEYVFDFHAPRR